MPFFLLAKANVLLVIWNRFEALMQIIQCLGKYKTKQNKSKQQQQKTRCGLRDILVFGK